MLTRSRRLALLLAVLCAAPAAAAGPAPFADRVAPLLRQRCLSCHGAKRRGGLDLTTRAGLLKGGDGGAVVVPGSAAKSRLLRMVSGPDATMPKLRILKLPEFLGIATALALVALAIHVWLPA